MNVTNELIYYDENFKGEHGDFSGKEAALTAEGQTAFLQKYSDFQRKVHRLGEDSEKAVPQEKIAEALRAVSYEVEPKVRESVCLETAAAFLRKKPREYKGWDLYTKRARVEDGAVVFSDGKITPIPCAQYTFKDGERLTGVALSVYISSEYKKERVNRTEKDIPHAVSTGRIVELRAGKNEIVKIQFYASGAVCARIGVPDIYHHKQVVIGNWNPDAWNTLELRLHGDLYDVAFNGVVTEDLALTCACAPDTLFLSGGFHPRGVWKVKPCSFTYGKERRTAFFERAETENAVEEPLGEVKLPFGVGGYENRDKSLILRRAFRVQNRGVVTLVLDSLDPGGRAFVNGIPVLETDSFMKERVDITAAVKDGENLLEIVIEPRAPEILYSWHRSQDCHIGWFCNEIRVESYGKERVERVDIKTERVEKGIADVTVNVKAAFTGKKTLRIYLAQTNPKRGEERLVYTGAAQAEERIPLRLEADAWTAETPVLYAVRVQLDDEKGEAVDDLVTETGFRTLSQKGGAFLLNGEKTLLRGALIMQFLAPYENISVSHVCPTDKEIVWQLCALQGMNANLARLHQLGYGTSDDRWARYCDRLGIMLVWTTRYIDSVEGVQWGDWEQGDLYVKQIEEVKQHPSIVVWEGSNEYRAVGNDIDRLYDQFVSKVKKADDTRLLCPCSHLYYGGNLSGVGVYYRDDGKTDSDGNEISASFGWTDELVIRSTHPYCMTLGYGGKWNAFRRQDWGDQRELLENSDRAYMVTEMATIGRQDERTAECRVYVKTDSYELSDERATFGRQLTQADWRISQAYQALSAAKAIQLLRAKDVDGLAWCCLSGGANDASYMKPPVDFYGYAKYAYYAIGENYQTTVACNESTDVVYGGRKGLQPCILGAKPNETYTVSVCVYDENDRIVDEKRYENVAGDEQKIVLGEWQPKWHKNGYYRVAYEVVKE